MPAAEAKPRAIRRGVPWTMQHKPARPGRRQGGPRGYFELSRRPLHILAFLIPLIAAYEVGSILYLGRRDGFTETIRAHSIILGFFQDFGIAGRYLPGVALATVLLVWHILSGERWRIRTTVIPLMILESLAWTIPLLVMIALVQRTGAPGGLGPALGGPTGDVLASLPWQARATVAVGAGLYEELLFRMIGIAALHLVLVDLARMSDRAGSIVAVALTAVAFVFYHDVVAPSGHFETLKAAQLLCAGAYFGALFLYRGFGIVVAVHALYDIVALVVLPAHAGGS
jgi:hypothetical protein